jgi:hypothetical protein
VNFCRLCLVWGRGLVPATRLDLGWYYCDTCGTNRTFGDAPELHDAVAIRERTARQRAKEET